MQAAPSRTLTLKTRPSAQGALRSGQSNFLRGSYGVKVQSALAEQVAVESVETAIECASKKVKNKTRKASAKRFKITGTGKVMHRHPNKQHLNEKKRRKRVVKLTGTSLVKDPDLDNIRGALPFSKL